MLASAPAVGWADNYAQAWSVTLDAAPNIATDYSAWLRWMYKRVGQFASKCPLARGTTYYVSNAGSDSNDGLTTSTPLQTLAAVQTIFDNYSTGASVNARFRFKRGDIWTQAAGLTIPQVSDLTIDDYGSASDANPLFNRFSKDYTASTWVNAAGNRWTLAETATIVWVSEIADRLGRDQRHAPHPLGEFRRCRSHGEFVVLGF
jgi:hypothetical protein